MRSRPRRLAGSLLAAALAVTACSGDDGPTVELGEVTRGDVVETVAAPARLEPRDRVTVSAPASGTVAELLVADGDRVASGDPLVRLTSPSVEQTVAQAEAAVDAADALAGVEVGVDLSPLLAVTREQLQAVVPDLLGELTRQAEELPDRARDRAFEAIGRLTRSYDATVTSLHEAEHEAAAAARSADASQQAVAAAQRDQAELALEAARDRADDLLVTATTSGVVELARGDAPSGATPGLEDLAAGGAEGLSGVEDLLGGGTTTTSTAPIAVGSEVAAGQPLLTVFDLSEFRAVADVDEIDVIEVMEGQDAVVLVDAFGDEEIDGTVEHVALEPRSGAAGGVLFPVTVRLQGVPEAVRLRVGLSGSVEVTTRVVEDAVVVPSSALRRRGERDVVFVVRDDVVRELEVVVDAIGDDTAAVEGGLEPGDRVVVSGLEEVSDGDPAPT